MRQREPLSKSGQRPAINPLALYLMSLAGMIGLYSLYAKFVVPVIAGPTQRVQPRLAATDIELPALPFDKTQLTQLLPADAWEKNECKTLLTSEGAILFFKDFEPVDGYLEVFPFTLVTTSESDEAISTDAVAEESGKSKPPTFLRCLRGARLKLDKPVSEMFSGQAKMESAQLMGQVNIFRPPSSPTAEDGLTISTSNVQIEKNRIFTIEEVSFAIGMNRGSGKNLLIQLAHHMDANEITGDFSSIRGIKRIELAFLDHLRLESSSSKQLDAGDSDSVSLATKNQSDQPIPNLDSPLSIECSGPFVFDLDERKATFSDQVLVRMENEYRDQITADLLTVFFEEKPDDGITPIDSVHQPNKLTLQRLVARGSPAVMFSPERAAKISAEKFSYDAIKRYFVAESESTPTTIVSPDYHVVALRIGFQPGQSGSLGIIDATGPGKLLRVANENQKEFLVQWQKRLTVQPDGLQHQVQITGDAKVRLDRDTAIQSESIVFWLNETEVVAASDDGTIKTSKNFQPVKLIAQENVIIKSPRIDGMTQRLTANWTNVDAQNRTGLLRNAGADQRLAFTGRVEARRPLYQMQQSLLRPDQNPVSTNSNGMQTIRKNQTPMPISKVAQVRFDEEVRPINQKFSFQGNEVVAKLIAHGDQTEVKDLTVTGNVTIEEISSEQSAQNSVAPQAAKRPLNIKGELLRCIPQPQNQMRLLVAGTPERAASVVGKNLELQGQNIHLDQAANKLWVDGAGTMNLEAIQPTNEPATTEAGILKSTKQNQNVTVSWHGGMIFDGTKLYFEDQVAMESRGENKEGKPVAVSSQSAGLSLKFNRTIRFQDLQNESPSGDIDIQETVIVDRLPTSQRVFKLAKSRTPQNVNHESIDPAMITNQVFDLQGELVEQQQFLVTQATWNSTTGGVNSKGPGVFMYYRKGGSLLMSNKADAQSNSSVEPTLPFGNSNGLTFIRVNFDESVNANINQNEMTVRGNVRTLYAPVESFTDILDPDQPERLPLESVKVTCEQMKIAQWTPRNSTEATNELIATGNAHISSSTFEATADRVSYNRSTDILVVEGTPRSDAHLWFKQTPNARQRDHLVAGKILYRVSDQWTEVQGVRNVNINRK